MDFHNAYVAQETKRIFKDQTDTVTYLSKFNNDNVTDVQKNDNT